MQPAVGPAADGGEEAAGGGLLRLRQRLDPGLDLVLGRARGVEVGRLRLGRHAGDEGRIVVEPRPRPLVDQEVVEARAAEGRLVADERHEQGLVARPDLAQEKRIQDSRRLDELGQRLPLARGQLRDVDADGHRRKPRGHGLEPRDIRHRIGHGLLLAGEPGGQAERDHGQRRDPRAGPEVDGHGMSSCLRAAGPLWASSLRARETVNESASVSRQRHCTVNSAFASSRTSRS